MTSDLCYLGSSGPFGPALRGAHAEHSGPLRTVSKLGTHKPGKREYMDVEKCYRYLKVKR